MSSPSSSQPGAAGSGQSDHGDAAAERGRPVALVTGSAKGAGRAMLLALAEDGYDVAVHYLSSAQAAAATAEEARSLGARAFVLRADVTSEDEARGLIDAVAAEYGRLDVLVNNVGNYHKGPLSELGSATWREMFASNLDSVFYLCQQALPHLRAAPRGRIVNLGFAGSEILKARPAIAPYAIAKTGVILYSKALALTEAASGVTVNVISPGVLETSVSKPVDKIPVGRLGTLEELVGALRYLLSPEAAYVTGVNIEVAGGWNL